MQALIQRYPLLSDCASAIEAAAGLLVDGYRQGGQVLVCGNGGSCADSEHIVGELMKGFLDPRPVPSAVREALLAHYPEEGAYFADHLQGALPAIALPSQTAVLSAFANDVQPDMGFAQLVYGYGRPGDVLLGLTTSGRSRNVVNAAKIAKIKDMKVIALVGRASCPLDEVADVVIHVPADETFRVQELHLPVYHYLCAHCEQVFFS